MLKNGRRAPFGLTDDVKNFFHIFISQVWQ